MLVGILISILRTFVLNITSTTKYNEEDTIQRSADNNNWPKLLIWIK